MDLLNLLDKSGLGKPSPGEANQIKNANANATSY